MLRMTFTPRKLAIAAALSTTALFGTACSAADTELAEPSATASTSLSARGTAPVSEVEGEAETAAMLVDEQTSATAAPAPADGGLAPQNASRFEAGLGTYNVRFSEGNWCSYFSMAGKLECGLELTGTLPPSTQRLDIGGLHTIQYSQDQGFYWGRALVGTMPDNGDNVAPGEKLEAPGALFEHHPDGTLRVEFENHWFTVSPDGQYASDTFDPAQ